MSARTMGVVFILASGILYTVERAMAKVGWGALVLAGAGYPTHPQMPGLFDNLFVFAFLVAGIVLLVLSRRSPLAAKPSEQQSV